MSPQQTIAHYRVTAKLGEGGMGEVWRATDTRLGRDVALKILPSSLARDPERMARFEREAKVLASLNHPNIAQIYGIEERALVMELVEGETLRGPLPLDTALEYARQIGDALEAAHEKGIVHRDLKPGNIMVTAAGVVKVLDFGLARASEEPAGDPENSPTQTISPTRAGVILGTAAYMSPEQARGKVVDKRADIWAFGCVLYEMLTGQRAFTGETTTDILAAVMKSEPDLARVPARVRRLVRRCLEKDPKRRLRDIGDAVDLLDNAPAVGAATVRERLLTPITPWAVAALSIALAAVAFWVPWRGGRFAPDDVVRFTMDTAPAEMLGPEKYCCRPTFTSLALSPDGKTVVFSGVSGSASASQVQLYKRTMDQSNAVPLAGTAGAEQPFFSPDGQWVGFWAEEKLKKIPVSGGPALAICGLPPAQFSGPRGASWSASGNIAYIVRAGTGTDLMEVPESGGTPKVIMRSGSGNLYWTPEFLPDGKTVLLTLLTGDWESAQIVARRLDTGEQRMLLKSGANAHYIPTGHLVYLQRGVLMAVPFDARRLELTGPPVAIIEGVMQSINMPTMGLETGMGQFAISASGNLVYANGSVAPLSTSTLKRVDRKGTETELNAPKRKAYTIVRISPDGSRMAVSLRNGIAARDIWGIDTNTGTATRLTSQGPNTYPLWSPDGKRILFSSGAGYTRLFSVPADGSGAPEPVMSGQTLLVAASWPTERLPLVYVTGSDHSEIWSRPMSGRGEPKPFLQTGFSLEDGELSPDGHWMAYRSNESGADEVYVQAFPGPGEKHRISTAGGGNPAWARNGRELFYLEPRGSEKMAMMAVDFTVGGSFQAGTPRVLFERPLDYSNPVRGYDVTPDAQHFIMLQPDKPPEEHVSKLNVVLHWSDELKRRAPSNK